ncbi:sialidase family protein [Paraburkholderia phytofirmans]|uniref:Exo-alpha-sialidase n=1 Tax=Paraburkholderia phytofirmans TaxID=261302 RepID=A0ABW9BB48_9BURK
MTWQKMSFLRHVSFVILSFLSVQSSAKSGNNFDAIVSTEVVNPPQNIAFCHASTVAFSQGHLVAAWLAGSKEAANDVGVWVARFSGNQWSPPVRVADGRSPDGEALTVINPILFSPKRGPLMLFYRRGKLPADWHPLRMTSLDGGATWTKPAALGPGISGPAKDKPVELSNGVVIAGSSTEYDGWRIHFERSMDGGNTWHVVYPAVGLPTVQAIQPTILDHRHGQLQALVRTKSGFVFSTKSSDWGKTWSALARLDIPNSNSGLDAVTLTDGRDLIVTNPLPYVEGRWDRHKLSVLISADRQTYRDVLDLENEAGQEFSYPAVIQSPDGMVHITYTWKKIYIKHVVLDPKRIYASRSTLSAATGHQ